MFLLMSFLDLFNCPICMLSNHGLFVVQRVLQNGERVHVTRVAEGDCHVSQVAASFGAGERTPLEALIKSLGCEGQFLGQRGKRLFIQKSGITFGGESIPRANLLTDVASKHPGANLFTQLNGNVIFKFNREV